jgi:Ca2+-transporting ATPase
MTATRLCTFDSVEDKDEHYEFYPYRGFSPNGALWKAGALSEAEKKVADETFDVEEIRCDFQSAIHKLNQSVSIDYADDVNENNPEANAARAALLAFALNSHATELKRDEQADASGNTKSTWECVGNMTEGALVTAGHKCGFDPIDLNDVYTRVYDVPFNSQRKMAMSVHKLAHAGTNGALFGKVSFPKHSYFVVVKGATDRLLPFITGAPVLKNKMDTYSTPMNSSNLDALHESVRAAIEDYNQEGLRALLCLGRGLTQQEWDHLKSQDGQAIFDAVLADKPIMSSSPENGGQVLCMGLVGISDPPKHDVKAAVELMNGAGVRVVMITGDHV